LRGPRRAAENAVMSEEGCRIITWQYAMLRHVPAWTSRDRLAAPALRAGRIRLCC
jgi:hypothetical protein